MQLAPCPLIIATVKPLLGCIAFKTSLNFCNDITILFKIRGGIEAGELFEI